MKKEINLLKIPTTATEIMLRLAEEERIKLLTWLSVNQNIIGKEIRIDISRWNAGRIGSFVCEIKRWDAHQK